MKVEKELDKHIEDKHAFPCNQCGFVGWSDSYLSSHKLEKHTSTQQLEHNYNEE